VQGDDVGGDEDGDDDDGQHDAGPEQEEKGRSLQEIGTRAEGEG